RFQSGVLRVDGSARSSFSSVAGAIAAAGQCATLHQWTHTNGVVGAAATFDVHDGPAQQGVFGFSATAAEPAAGTARIFPAPPTHTVASGAPPRHARRSALRSPSRRLGGPRLLSAGSGAPVPASPAPPWRTTPSRRPPSPPAAASPAAGGPRRSPLPSLPTAL